MTINAKTSIIHLALGEKTQLEHPAMKAVRKLGVLEKGIHKVRFTYLRKHYVANVVVDEYPISLNQTGLGIWINHIEGEKLNNENN